MQSLFQEALKFSANKHLGQKVPGSDLPYVCHLSNVAMEIFMAALNSENFDISLAVQVALLHDTIEDTYTNHDELLTKFGKEVADGVLALTKDFKLPKDLQLQDSLNRIKEHSSEIWAVKMADRITNLQKPPKHWSNEKKTQYMGEAKLIYIELKEGNQYLANRLEKQINEYPDYI